MAETSSTAEAPAEKAGAAANNNQSPETDWENSEGRGGKAQVLAELKEYRAQAKEAAALRTRLQELEDRDKSETQKASERAEAAERAASDAASKLMRYEVAAQKNLPSTWISRLQGTTADELRADADELLKLLPSPGGAGGSFDSGTRRPAPKPDDMNSLIRRAAGRG